MIRSPTPEGWYEPTFTVHSDDNPLRSEREARGRVEAALREVEFVHGICPRCSGTEPFHDDDCVIHEVLSSTEGTSKPCPDCENAADGLGCWRHRIDSAGYVPASTEDTSKSEEPPITIAPPAADHGPTDEELAAVTYLEWVHPEGTSKSEEPG